eukprot:997799-Rhodomonas_salina.1
MQDARADPNLHFNDAHSAVMIPRARAGKVVVRAGREESRAVNVSNAALLRAAAPTCAHVPESADLFFGPLAAVAHHALKVLSRTGALCRVFRTVQVVLVKNKPFPPITGTSRLG